MLLPVLIVVITLLLVLLAAFSVYGRWGASRGATIDEVNLRLEGDQWLDNRQRMHLRMTRAIWIDAPPEQVWPWIAQMGRGAGWYSHDLLDNGRRKSAEHVVSWIPEPELGDAAVIGYLRHLVPGQELAWWLKGTQFLGAWLRGVMFYRVTPDGARSRLVVRIQADAQGWLAQPACWLFRIMDCVMAWKQIKGIKQRVENFGDPTENPDCPETGKRDQYQLYQVIYASGESAGQTGRRDAVAWRRSAIDDGVIANV